MVVVTVALTLGALTAGTVDTFAIYPPVSDTFGIILRVLVPVTVFIVNMVVMREVRRASNSAAANLGRQQHHPSTSSNSAVPTVMLVTTSLLAVNLGLQQHHQSTSSNSAVPTVITSLLAANLGLHQHHQSTSFNSAVPTVMLVTTSLLYVLLSAPDAILWVLLYDLPDSAWCSETWKTLLHAAAQSMYVSYALYKVMFAYNFFVYVITSEQFRSELRQLCSCTSADNNAPAAAART